MYTLLLDTSNYSLVALSKNKEIISCEINHVALNQSESLIPMIEKCMESCGIWYDQISSIGLNTGPGSFTGIRVGMSITNSILISNKNLIICGISDLDILKYRAIRQVKNNFDLILVISEYTKNNCILGLYEKKDRLLQKKLVKLVENSAILDEINSLNGKVVCIGDGLSRIYKDMVYNKNFLFLPRLTKLNPKAMLELTLEKISNFLSNPANKFAEKPIFIDFDIFEIID